MGLLDAAFSNAQYWESYAQYMVEKTGLNAIIQRLEAGAAEARAAALMAEINKLRAASLVAGGGSLILTLGVPIGAWVAMWVAMGAPYTQARSLIKNENFLSGFSQGYVIGLLKWDWSHAVSRFGQFTRQSYTMDETLGFIAANAHNGGLRTGFVHAGFLLDDQKKNVLSQLRSLSPRTRAGNWSRLDQINYVIELAAAGRRNSIFRL